MTWTAGAAEYAGTFDLICFCDCLHDMGDPVGIARHAKARLAPGGSVMLVEPSALDEVIESSAGIVENCFSSGVATADAIVSGEAPGRLADTWIVGKSTFGNAATGNRR